MGPAHACHSSRHTTLVLAGVGADAVDCEKLTRAYSEAAAAFEVAIQAVKLWIADRVVLHVKNSLGSSIHRNCDLLLRHCLHIIGEIQLPVHHCLLALPRIHKEILTRVISHPQALAQCELLNAMGLNVAREAIDDTAATAESVAIVGLWDTAAIASYRAADLYGFQVLVDGIQSAPESDLAQRATESEARTDDGRVVDSLCVGCWRPTRGLVGP
ncbi:arogenate dehydratase 1-like [Oryza brachyantha]|uniref:arogenate dehydratase 1-like n=1 Tax=Oryza brachyantha TaxID=4533 RepID=UPI001ADBC1A2|nr:arogenate dehydratase 1-like [Oryza brachyantha]